MKILVRILEFATRFVIGIQNFGVSGAIKVFLFYRRRNLPELTFIHLRMPNRHFYFRGASDRGVISHFYKAGYRICDKKSADKVRFIIDAGANIGDETIRFRHFHPDATIIAIEPEANNFQVLKRNTEGDHNIICLNKGIWSRECRLRVISSTSNEAFTVMEVDDSIQDYDVVAVSIGHLMKEFRWAEIDILKMDIEGAERQVFDSAVGMDWLSKVKVLIFECPDNDSPGTTMLIFEKLLQTAGQKFNSYIHGENIVMIRQDVTWTLATDVFLEA